MRLNSFFIESPHGKGMSIQTQIADVTAPPFHAEDQAKALDRTARRRLGLYDKTLRDRHIALRQRFADQGGEGLSDPELLELILLRSAPRSDTRTTAKTLLAEFGDLGRVISASHTRLTEITDAVPAGDLKLIEATAQRLARGRIQSRPLISSWDAVISYCRTTLAHRETEEFRVLFLDRRNMLIADEVLGTGTVDHVPVYPREVLKRALELNSCAIILVHNHPSGDPTPSDSDIEMTKLIKQAAQSLSITLHDHLIVGATSETSLVSAGLL